jgi:hypothetical protein
MALNPEPKYPNRRTYVVQLRGDATADALAGRIENFLTGRQREFSSAPELLEHIVRDIEAPSDEPALRASGA